MQGSTVTESPAELFASLAKRALKHVAETAFKTCSRPGCKAHSMGFICSTCSRFVCNEHGYWTLAVRPQVICEACIALSASPEDEPAKTGEEPK
jgi:hypothetical protein